MENDKNKNLLHIIKALRQHFHVKFMDIVLASFSISLEKYLIKKQSKIPEKLTVVLPVRMEIERMYYLLNFYNK